MIESEERDDVTPLCPHCNTAISNIQFRRVSTFLGRRYVYFCAGCKKVLGISHRKGFWMG